jgi:nitroreductase
VGTGLPEPTFPVVGSNSSVGWQAVVVDLSTDIPNDKSVDPVPDILTFNPHSPARSRLIRTSGSSIYPAVQNMLLAARALGLGATLTTLYLSFEKEAEAALGLPAGAHSYALLPIGYPMGRFGPVRRVALSDVVYEDRWGQSFRD